MTSSIKIQDGSRIDANLIDECPAHGEEMVAEYDFGMMDANLIKWGCGCCSVAVEGSESALYFTTYRKAVGQARLCVAMAAAK
jgi:hypothetical protein